MLDDGADDLGRHDRRLGAEHGQLRHVELAQARDDGPDRVGRMSVHELRQRRACLALQHVADARLGGLGGEEAVVGHPLVVEDLAQVAAASVGQQHHDDVIRLGIPGDLERGDHGHAAGAASQQRFLAGEASRHQERVRVADRDDLVADALVVGLRPDVLADALDEVRAARPAGVDRSFRVGTNNLHPAARDLLEVASGARDRAAGADAGHEVGHPALGLRPDLRPGRQVVGVRVLHVGVLVRLPAAGRLPGEPVRDRVIGVRMVRGHGRRADDDLGAVRAQHADLVLADLVGAHEQAPVALLLGHDGQAHAGIARRRLHDGAAWLEFAGLLGGLDHPQRDPVLDRAAGIEVLDLGQHGRAVARAWQGAGDLAQPQQRRIADEVDQGIVDLHLSPPLDVVSCSRNICLGRLGPAVVRTRSSVIDAIPQQERTPPGRGLCGPADISVSSLSGGAPALVGNATGQVRPVLGSWRWQVLLRKLLSG